MSPSGLYKSVIFNILDGWIVTKSDHLFYYSYMGG